MVKNFNKKRLKNIDWNEAKQEAIKRRVERLREKPHYLRKRKNFGY